jgi:hypothetical protein
VIEDGVAGDWQPLATLVRLPVFDDLKCPDMAGQPCKLAGAKLFLVDSVSSDPQFTHPIQIPAGFPGYFLSVPRPTDGQLYVKLHDDPSVVNSITFPVEALRPLPNTIPTVSSRPAAHTPNSPVVNNSSPATTAPGTVAAPPSKSPTNEGTPPASNSDKTTPQASPAVQSNTGHVQQSSIGVTQSRSVETSSPQG